MSWAATPQGEESEAAVALQLLEGYPSPMLLFLRNQLRGLELFFVLLFLKGLIILGKICIIMLAD